MNLQELFLQDDPIFEKLKSGLNVNNDYTPINPNLLSYSTINKIIRSDSQLLMLKSLWLANIGRNGLKVIIEKNLTEKTKERLQKEVYKTLYSQDIEFDDLINSTVEYLFDEGNVIWLRNNENKLICHSISKFRVYQDSLNKTLRYDLYHQGQKVPGFQNLKNGEDLIHIKDPLFANFLVAPSRLNLLYIYLILEHAGLKTNIGLFQRGLINLTLIDFDEASLEGLNQKDPSSLKNNKEGRSILESMMMRLRDSWGGKDNSNSIQSTSGIKNVHELGKSNTDMQFVELLKFTSPERKAWAYSATLSDLGAGNNTTYNNTQTFSYAMYNKVGRHFERAIIKPTNNFILKNEGLQTEYYSDFFVDFQSPTNPDWKTKVEQARLDWQNNLITLNQWRDLNDLPPVDNGDVYKSEWDMILSSGLLPNETSETDLENLENSKKKIKNRQKTTLSNKAKRSKNGQKLEKKLGEAIENQVIDWANSLKSKPKKIKLPKITNYLSVDQMAKLQKPFAEIALEDVKKKLNKKYKKQNIKFDLGGGFPDWLLEAISERAFYVLEGGKLKDSLTELTTSLFQDEKTFAGIDEYTSQLISTYVAAYADEALAELVKNILSEVKDLSRYRASMIATTEITNTIEGSRYMLYKKETNGEVKMEWSTIMDGNQGEDHEMNDGEIRKLGKKFPSGETRPGQRPNCRCTTLASF